MTGVSSMAQQTNTGGSGSFYTPAGSPNETPAQRPTWNSNYGSASSGALISGQGGTGGALASIGGFGFGAPIAAGFAERASLRTEARNMGYQAKAAQLEGQRQALLAMDDFSRSQARAIAAIGASGIGYEGSPITGLHRNEERIKSAKDMIAANTQAQVASIKFQQKQLRRQARLAPTLGFIKGVQNVVGMFVGGGLSSGGGR